MTQRQPRSTSTAKIAGLTLVNAMVFQEILADYNAQVHHLQQTLQFPDSTIAFADHWEFILQQINYHPIFYVAHQLLIALPNNPDTERAIRDLARTAREIVSQRAALRHDLMGRVYHKLLAEAKYLGTYYTSVPAATLLLKLALDPKHWDRDWADLGELSQLRIGDLACGTGTLLMAAAEAVTDNYLRTCGEQRVQPHLDRLSQLLMEDNIYGYDVLLSALHLTASTLSLRAPDVTFRSMHLWSLPFGGPSHSLGSIEFFRDFQIPIITDLFGASATPGQVTATGTVRNQVASLPDLDLCVMNPPFTRSVGGNLLFGSLPEAERQPMQRELARLLRRPLPRIYASSTAGLGSVFTALGDFHLKVGGRIALVLPKALLSGVAWQQTRELFRLKYQLEHIIVSHDPTRWNFSDNTDLSEVLVVGRKVVERTAAAPPHTNESVVCVNLWKNPATAIEALNVSHVLVNGHAPDLETGQGALEIYQGNAKIGEAIAIPWEHLREGIWMGPCAYAQADLLRIAHALVHGQLRLPGIPQTWSILLCPLSQLGTLGPDRRDVYDGFQLSTQRTPYPAFWGHDATTMTTLAQVPNTYLSPLARPRQEAGGERHLREATDLWPRAGRIFLAERLWNYTQRLAALRLERNGLSNVWWPYSLYQDDVMAEKALVLWLNSTLGLVVLWSYREETRGAWVQFKKPVLSAMPVLDVRVLTVDQKQALAKAYDDLCQQPLQPFPQMATDPVRAELDKAICKALNLPDIAPLRALLAREPVVCLRPLY